MKKLIITLIILTLVGCSQPQAIEPVPIKQTVNPQVLNEIEIAEPSIPIYDIPMSAELQGYTYELCKYYALPYELVLAVIHTESRFDPNADSGSSKGLMQLNTNTYPALAKELGLEIDPMNSVDNVTAGIYYLAKLRDAWQGYSDEEVFSLMLISYNRGVQGCKDYVRKYGLDNIYVTKVYEYKIKLEQQNIYSQ